VLRLTTSTDDGRPRIATLRTYIYITYLYIHYHVYNVYLYNIYIIQYFKQHNYTTIGHSKLYHPGHPVNFDEPQVRKRRFFAPFYKLTMIILPRQARNKHGKS
jgi:hypothetical protein